MLARGTTSIVLSGFAAVAMLAACTGARGGSAQAPVDLAIAPIGSLPEAKIVSNGERSSGRCALRLVAARIEKSAPGCYLDEHLTEGPGTLHYPCKGDGPAEADFGEHRYTGRIERGELELELSTELDWEDGCRWGTQASITGTVTAADGEPTLKKLSWKYVDRVITGVDCSGVCKAKTSIDVTRAKSPNGSTQPQLDDDDEDRD